MGCTDPTRRRRLIWLLAAVVVGSLSVWETSRALAQPDKPEFSNITSPEPTAPGMSASPAAPAWLIGVYGLSGAAGIWLWLYFSVYFKRLNETDGDPLESERRCWITSMIATFVWVSALVILFFPWLRESYVILDTSWLNLGGPVLTIGFCLLALATWGTHTRPKGDAP